MGLTVGGLGSGLDTEGMITKLMAIEAAPLTQLQSKQVKASAKISAWGTVKSAVAEFQTATQAMQSATAFNSLKGTSSDRSPDCPVLDTGDGGGDGVGNGVRNTVQIRAQQVGNARSRAAKAQVEIARLGYMAPRLREAAKLGFSVAVVPQANAPKKPIEGLTIHAVERVEQAIDIVRSL